MWNVICIVHQSSDLSGHARSHHRSPLGHRAGPLAPELFGCRVVLPDAAGEALRLLPLAAVEAALLPAVAGEEEAVVALVPAVGGPDPARVLAVLLVPVLDLALARSDAGKFFVAALNVAVRPRSYTSLYVLKATKLVRRISIQE